MPSLLLGDIVYKDDMFTATEWGGRMFMYWTNTICGDQAESCGQIIDGRKSFEKKYKGDFKKWIDQIQKREHNTIISYLSQAKELEEKAERMIILNGFDISLMETYK